MDHKVSKDMISSGMIPSGEKTQADLGKTQYGSAPSPSKLMDAYKSMYGNKEEVINEMAGKGMGMTPAPKPGGITPYKDPKKVALPTPQDPATSKPQKDFIKARMSDSPAPKTETKPETKSMVDTVRDRRKEVVSARREKVQGIMNKYGESVDLLAAYRAVYEHHKKDADGNTIPHEDEEVNEGKIPAGLQAYLDKKKGKKEDKKEVKEEMDLFDVISTHFINEGYEEKDVYKAMSSLTKDQLQNLDEAIPVIGAALAAIPAIAGKLAAGAAGLAKGGMAAAKGIGAVTKGVVSAAKGGASSLKAGMKGVASAAKGAIKAPPKITSSGGNVVQGSSNTGGNKIMDFAKRETGNKVRQELMKDRQVSGTNKTGTASAKTTDIAASADLFDIVKGQLLDEGLSEEEIKDIMLTLTPDEILKEMEDKPMEVNVADAKANTPAYQNYMKGMKRKTDGKPMYTASQDMKDRAKGLK